eukprot:6188337-Pleurochrysis_carterae.AAC.6
MPLAIRQQCDARKHGRAQMLAASHVPCVRKRDGAQLGVGPRVAGRGGPMWGLQHTRRVLLRHERLRVATPF